jgi:mycofactocin biosynthesis protein MftB
MACAASTEHDPMLDGAWILSPSVALRPEPFGALAYHFGNRKLTFLKRPELVTLVQDLGRHPDVRTALTAAAIPAAQHPAFVDALRGLAATDMIRPRQDSDREASS